MSSDKQWEVRQHFVRFLSPGTLVPETNMIPVESWDVNEAKELADTIVQRHGATPYAFQFITRGRTKEDLDSVIVDKSPLYHLGGTILTLEQVKARNDPDDKILISNMEINKIARVVENLNSYKAVNAFGEDDILLEYTPPAKREDPE
jgi:hypothetical protein